jgi:hypothetical protein
MGRRKGGRKAGSAEVDPPTAVASPARGSENEAPAKQLPKYILDEEQKTAKKKEMLQKLDQEGEHFPGLDNSNQLWTRISNARYLYPNSRNSVQQNGEPRDHALPIPRHSL